MAKRELMYFGLGASLMASFLLIGSLGSVKQKGVPALFLILFFFGCKANRTWRFFGSRWEVYGGMWSYVELCAAMCYSVRQFIATQVEPGS